MNMPNLHRRLIQRSCRSQAPLWRWWLAAILGLAVARLVQLLWLDPAYAASQYPVPFYVGQTTFDAAELKGYFQVMLDRGTLPLYWWTQCIDFVFIICTYGAFFALSQSIFHSLQRLLPRASVWQNLAKGMCFVSPLAAIADAAENILSFIMLLQPLHFPDFLVFPYSTFAVTKFFIFALTYLWAMIMIAALALIAGAQGIQNRLSRHCA